MALMKEAGIRVLADSAAVASGIRVIGRDDRSNHSRKALQDIAPEDSLFTIVLDHQPYHLEEAEQYGADFQFSGHTHHGQIWPGNWLTDAMYEKAFGEHRRGDTRYYISSGLGIWGGKFRIGTRSEYVVLRIKNSYL
jgi:predicted MPP superfamily phosphohydrolase